MGRETLFAVLEIEELQITNPNISETHINNLVNGLKTEQVRLYELEPVFVRVKVGEGYFVADGNHRVEAMKRAGVKQVLAEIYYI